MAIWPNAKTIDAEPQFPNPKPSTLIPRTIDPKPLLMMMTMMTIQEHVDHVRARWVIQGGGHHSRLLCSRHPRLLYMGDMMQLDTS